jgi:hypothetical protein
MEISCVPYHGQKLDSCPSVKTSSVNLEQVLDEISHAEKLPDRFAGEIRAFCQIRPFTSDGVDAIRNWNWIGKVLLIPLC